MKHSEVSEILIMSIQFQLKYDKFESVVYSVCIPQLELIFLCLETNSSSPAALVSLTLMAEEEDAPQPPLSAPRGGRGRQR